MHTALGLASMILVLLGSYLALAALQQRSGWSARRPLQLLILAAPVTCLGLGIGGLYHFAGRPCLLSAPVWDQLLGVMLPLATALVAVVAIGLGLVRLVLLDQVVFRNGAPAPLELEAQVQRLAGMLGAPTPRIFLRAHNGPLALVCGLRSPTLVLSTRMLEHLDSRELESVLAHELSHLARRDYPVAWIATILRDAFFYLPSSQRAFRQIQQDKELACDELAVSVTGRPLALASALAKVWQQSLSLPTFTAAQPLLEPGTAIEGRIERLLASSGATTRSQSSDSATLSVGGLLAIGLILTLGLSIVIVTEAMGCGPTWLLSQLP